LPAFLSTAARSRATSGVLAAMLSLVVMGGLTALVGVAPSAAYKEMWSADFGSSLAFSATLLAALPLVLVALGFIVGYRSGVFNIGLEGQLAIGALAASIVGSKLNVPGVVHLPLSVLAGAVGGAAWAAIPALLRLWRSVNEIVSSLMLNFVALLLVGWLIGGPLKDGAAVNPQSSPVAKSAEMPQVLGLPGGLIVVALAALALSWLLGRTRLGFEMRTSAASATVAAHVGIPVRRVVWVGFLLSGACAGLGGAVELIGNQLVLTDGFSSGWGFTGIAVALIGGLNPWGCMLAGFFFAALEHAGSVLQFSLGVPASFAVVVEAVAVLLVLSAGFVRERRLRQLGRRDRGDSAATTSLPAKASVA
jgi:ABC-type uncharacterized transport system permease subunit